MPTNQESLLQEAHEIIKQRDKTIFIQRVNIATLISEKYSKNAEIARLKSELDYAKSLVAVYDDSFREAFESKEDAETIGRLVREIAGHKE